MSLFYYPFPTPAPSNDERVLVEVNAQLVPVVISALERYKYPQFWATSNDAQAGIAAINELQRELLMGSQDIVTAIDRLYRLIDTSFNGTDYFVRLDPATGKTIVDPPIADVPPDSTTAANAMRAHLGRVWHLVENSTTGATFGPGAGIVGGLPLADERPTRDVIRDAQGLLNAGWFGIGGQPATIADIVRALRVGSDADQGIINNALEEILNAGGNTSGIFNAVRGLFDTGVNTLGEGGTLAVLLASTIAQAAIAGLTGAQLDAINTRLTTIDGRLVDNEQNIDIVEWTKAGTGAAQAIKAYISQGIDPTTLQSLLIAIRDKPVGGGTGGTVTLDPDQLAELVNLLECICEATNGPPTTPEPPQFDPELCGPGWQLIATWRPTITGTLFTPEDGEWTLNSGSALVSLDTSPEGYKLLRFQENGQPHDCRVWWTLRGDFVGGAVVNLVPLPADGGNAGAGRPTLFLNVPRACTQFLAWGRGASNQDMAYGVGLGPEPAGTQIGPADFALFVAFEAFG